MRTVVFTLYRLAKKIVNILKENTMNVAHTRKKTSRVRKFFLFDRVQSLTRDFAVNTILTDKVRKKERRQAESRIFPDFSASKYVACIRTHAIALSKNSFKLRAKEIILVHGREGGREREG